MREGRLVRRAVLLVLLGPVAWLVYSCGPGRSPIRNVVLISIDTLRADRVSSYGFPRPTTPHIDALAREGVLFRNVYSPVPNTLPAHASMLTGTLPPAHGIRDNLHKGLPGSAQTLAELLKSRGFTTAAVVSSFVLDHRFNLAQGFDSYDDRFQAVHNIGDFNERKGDETTRVASEWLTSHGREPFFLFVHYYDPHDPYDPPEPFASRFAGDPYSGEVAFADEGVGQVLDKLKELGLYESTLVVITGDHGEMLGEHGEANHGFFIYESALKVPLILRAPGSKARGLKVDQTVGLIDIMPTIAALVGAPAQSQAQGVDLSPWLSGKGTDLGGRTLYAETIAPTTYYGASSLLGVIADRWKYIETSRPELYDLKNDPGELTNLLSKESRRAEAMSQELKRIVAIGLRPQEGGKGAPLDASARERLQSLGYLSRGGGTPEVSFDRSREDPKDLIGFFRTDQKLSKLVESKKYAEARVLCDQMLKERPGFADCHLQMSRMAAEEGNLKAAFAGVRKALELSPGNEPARLHLAGLLKSQGDIDGAIRQYQEALKSQPDSVEAQTLLGRALAERGRFDEAVSSLGSAVASEPGSAMALTQLGFAREKQGKLPEAIENYRKALSLDPGAADARAYLGSALATQGKLDEAIEQFQLALKSRPESADLHDWLGTALREKGRPDEALVHFREAVRLDPGLAVAHLNLGRALKQRGDVDEAMRHYRRAIALNPRLAAAYNNLGSALGSKGQIEEAVRQFKEALRLQADYDEAHNNLAIALRMMGARDEALPHFKAALAGRPDWPGPMSEIAWILATHTDAKVRNPAESVRLAQRAAELTSGRDAVVLDTLAAAYASAGQWERATTTAESAVALASARSGPLASDIARRLALYRIKQPYREPAGVRPAASR